MATKEQTVTYYDATPAPTQHHTETAELAHEYHRHFLGMIPGALFVGTLSVFSFGVLSWTVIELHSQFLTIATLGACSFVAAIGAAYGMFTWFGFCTLEHERQEKQGMAGVRVMHAQWQLNQLINAPALPAPVDSDADPNQTRGEFLRHVEEFAKRSKVFGDKGQARSNWLRADGASEDYQFVSDGQRLSRPEYESIIRALDIRGRRKGAAGDAPALSNESVS